MASFGGKNTMLSLGNQAYCGKLVDSYRSKLFLSSTVTQSSVLSSKDTTYSNILKKAKKFSLFAQSGATTSEQVAFDQGLIFPNVNEF